MVNHIKSYPHYHRESFSSPPNNPHCKSCSVQSFCFVNCTFANYWSYNSRRSNATLFLQNYYYDANNNLILRPITECNFYNTIIYGSNEDEIMIDKKEGAEINYLFESCLLLTKSVRNEPPMVSNCIFNQDPLFNEPQEGDFRIKTNSPAIGKG